MSDLEKSPRGVLQDNVPIAFGVRHITPAIPEFLARYRAASYTLDTGDHALYPAHHHLSSKVRAFVDFLVDRFAPHPYWEMPSHGTERR